LVAAVRGFFTLKGALVFSFQKIRAESNINMRPGQRLIKGALSPGIEVRFKSGLSEGA
jgi:hypothetical protein